MSRRNLLWPDDDRARVQYVDVILSFATLVTFVAVAPWVYSAVAMATGVADPFSSLLLELTLPIFVVGMLVSIGVSARTGG